MFFLRNVAPGVGSTSPLEPGGLQPRGYKWHESIECSGVYQKLLIGFLRLVIELPRDYLIKGVASDNKIIRLPRVVTHGSWGTSAWGSLQRQVGVVAA